jgi:thiamine pyrophosphokinase
LRAVIFANGQINLPIHLQPDDLIIAADGGGRHCLDLGLTPDYVIGDLDSIDEQALHSLRSQGSQIIQYPRRKDYTDLELALRHAQNLGADDILILAALGARWDQTIANLLLPAAFPTSQERFTIRLVDGGQEMQFIRSGEQIHITGQPGDTVSLIPLGGDALGITTHNLEYPLVQGDIHFGSTLGISNVLLAESATIALRDGLLLCTIIHGGEVNRHSIITSKGE